MPLNLTAQIHQYLTEAPGSLFTQQHVEMLAHWEGDENLLWRVRTQNDEATVKLFLDAGQVRSRRQFDAHQLFAPVGLAPQPLWADRYPHGLSRQLIVYRWVDGEAINTNDLSELYAWADAIATLHATPAEEVRRFSPHPLNLEYFWRIKQGSITKIQAWLSESGLRMEGLFDQLAQALEQDVYSNRQLWFGAMPSPIHGDLSCKHTLLSRGTVLLLDWEMFGLGDPALDVARLLQREGQTLTDDTQALWLERYLRLLDQPGLADRITVFQRLLDVHNVVYLLVGLQQHTVNGVDGELREVLPFIQSSLTAALERAFSTVSIATDTDFTQLSAEFVAWLSDNPRVAH